MRVRLGDVYVDGPTGFTGIATARTEYLSGWVSVLIEARSPKEAVERWVHEARLVPADSTEAPGTYA